MALKANALFVIAERGLIAWKVAVGNGETIRAGEVLAALDALIEGFRGETQIIASRFAETSGIPMLFGRALWPELDALQGDKGGRQIIAKYPHLTASVDFEAAQFDLDTPDDVDAFRRRETSARL